MPRRPFRHDNGRPSAIQDRMMRQRYSLRASLHPPTTKRRSSLCTSKKTSFVEKMPCVRRASNAAKRPQPRGAVRDRWAFRKKAQYFPRSLLVNHLRSSGASGNSQNSVLLAVSRSRGGMTRSHLDAAAEMPEAFASKINRFLTKRCQIC